MHRKAGHAPHLKHLPAYLKDPTLATGRSEVGGKRTGGYALPPLKPVVKRGKKGDPLKAMGGEQVREGGGLEGGGEHGTRGEEENV